MSEPDRTMVEALDGMKSLVLAMGPFDNIDDPNIFDCQDEKGEDGWPSGELTPLGLQALKQARGAATEAARAVRRLQYETVSVPEAWVGPIRQCLEVTWALVPALESFERWEANTGVRYLCASEIITELVWPVRDAHRQLAEAHTGQTENGVGARTVSPPGESQANGATPKPISEDWARVEAIQTFRPLGQLGRALMDTKLEQGGLVDCPRLDDPGVAADIAFAAAGHLRRWADVDPPDKIGGAWLTLKATLAMIHVLADRLDIASHSSRTPKWDFSEVGTIPEQEVLDALDVLMRDATERYGSHGEWLGLD